MDFDLQSYSHNIGTVCHFNGLQPRNPCEHMYRYLLDYYSFTDLRGWKAELGLVGWPMGTTQQSECIGTAKVCECSKLYLSIQKNLTVFTCIVEQQKKTAHSNTSQAVDDHWPGILPSLQVHCGRRTWPALRKKLAARPSPEDSRSRRSGSLLWLAERTNAVHTHKTNCWVVCQTAFVTNSLTGGTMALSVQQSCIMTLNTEV